MIVLILLAGIFAAHRLWKHHEAKRRRFEEMLDEYERPHNEPLRKGGWE